MNKIDTDRLIEKLKEAFLDKNLECDGISCMGCWKDVVRSAISMLESNQPLLAAKQGEIESLKIENSKLKMIIKRLQPRRLVDED